MVLEICRIFFRFLKSSSKFEENFCLGKKSNWSNGPDSFLFSVWTNSHWKRRFFQWKTNIQFLFDEDAPKSLHPMGISALLHKTNSMQRLEFTVVFFQRILQLCKDFLLALHQHQTKSLSSQRFLVDKHFDKVDLSSKTLDLELQTHSNSSSDGLWTTSTA